MSLRPNRSRQHKAFFARIQFTRPRLDPDCKTVSIHADTPGHTDAMQQNAQPLEQLNAPHAPDIEGDRRLPSRPGHGRDTGSTFRLLVRA